VRLPRALADELVAHATDDLPNECCGLIAGRDGMATEVHRVVNTEPSPFFYVMDPRDQLRLMDRFEDEGLDLMAVYHSHTRSAAYPSRTDVELAFYPRTLYLIVSLADAAAPEIRAFSIRRELPPEQAITEVPVEIV
jgi:proteasome lid subunit RPN8/RPN11